MRLTLERAEHLRRQVLTSEVPHLNLVAVISGKSESVSGEIRGSVLLQPALGVRDRWTGKQGWVWRARGAPTQEDRDHVPDWPGISSGDPITYGHLEALGIDIPARDHGATPAARQQS